MGNTQTSARYKIKKKRSGQNLLDRADITINYHHYSVYFSDSIPPKLKSYIDKDIFDAICEHIREADKNTRKDLRKSGNEQCNWIGILLVLMIIFIIIGVECIDYWLQWMGWIFITISLLFLLCVLYLFKQNKPNTYLWWQEFITAMRIKIDDINQINEFQNQLYLTLINYDEEDNYTPIKYKQEQNLNGNKSLYSCRIHFEMIAKNTQNIIKLSNINDLIKLPTVIEYGRLASYKASKQTFVTIDEELLDPIDNGKDIDDNKDNIDDLVASYDINDTDDKDPDIDIDIDDNEKHTELMSTSTDASDAI